MERLGLVSHVEQDLEQTISRGILPEDGFLPSEQEMARRYGVSRTTIREALLRLSARGLVVQHPGRRSRAVALDEALTLENLGLALHAARRHHSQVRRLLEGYLELKRETLVELLAACCEHASAEQVRQLENACFALEEAARWQQEPGHWVQREFELLRLAARMANRPGHVLLIQSLERSFWGMAGRVLPHLDSGAFQRWAQCALDALEQRQVPALRRELLALLQANDERLIDSLMPTPEKGPSPQASHSSAQLPHQEKLEPGAAQGELPGAVRQNLSGCLTGLCEAPPPGDPSSEPASTGSGQISGHAALGTQSPSLGEERREPTTLPPIAHAVEEAGSGAADLLMPSAHHPLRAVAPSEVSTEVRAQVLDQIGPVDALPCLTGRGEMLPACFGRCRKPGEQPMSPADGVRLRNTAV